ncbi:MAG TPA: hypothetical protein VN231_03365 [Allosphingosinicella sp.]|nr:hypothetical protein [Allosphingosinicella sp.]
MKTLALAPLALLLMAATTAAPTAAQFRAALAAACPEPRAATRNISCARAEETSIQFSCSYEMQRADGSWAEHSAIVQQAEGEWVWIDGPTLCDEEEPSLN